MNCLEMLFWFVNHTSHDDLYHMVVRNMLKNIHDVPTLTIYELADACYTSPATISRLVKRLGYKSFAYFQKSLADSLGQYEHHNRHLPLGEMHEDQDHIPQLVTTIENMLHGFRIEYDEEKFSEVARMLHESKRVILYSQVIDLALSLQSDLVLDGIPCDVVDEVSGLNFLQDVDEHTTVLFSHSKRIDTTEIEKAAVQAKGRGAKIVVVTNSKYFSILKHADQAFVFKGKLHLVDTHMFSLYLAAIDVRYRDMYMDVK